jgi:hypothetical protein
MTHTTETGISRRKLLEAAGTAAAAIAAASLAGPGAADEMTAGFVPFKATAQGPIPDPLTIPLSPPIVSQHLQLTGSAAPLGDITHVEYHIARVGADGAFKSVSEAAGVMSNANGDAVFLSYTGLVRPTAAGGIMVESAFVITGGRGRFAGASGSGTLIANPDLVKKVVTFAWDGIVSAPKA